MTTSTNASHTTAQHLLIVGYGSELTNSDIKKKTGATSVRKLPYRLVPSSNPQGNPFGDLTFAYRLSTVVTGDRERYLAYIYVLSGSPKSDMLLLSQFSNDIYARVIFDRKIAMEFIGLAAVGHEISETRSMIQSALARTVKNNKFVNYCQKHSLVYPTLAPTTENDISSIGQIELDHYASKIKQLLAPSW